MPRWWVKHKLIFIFGWTNPLIICFPNFFFICNRSGNGFSSVVINADSWNDGKIFIYLSVHFLMTSSNVLLEVSFLMYVCSLFICNEHYENHIIFSNSAQASLQMLPVNVAVTVSAISASMDTRNQLGGCHLDPPFTEGETLDVLVFQQSDIRFRTTKCKPTAVWHII